jgi:hypothetical protein
MNGTKDVAVDLESSCLVRGETNVKALSLPQLHPRIKIMEYGKAMWFRTGTVYNMNVNDLTLLDI